MFYLTYDLEMYDDDETVCEGFDTVEELLERYKEIQYEVEVCGIEAWEDDKKIYPWV